MARRSKPAEAATPRSPLPPSIEIGELSTADAFSLLSPKEQREVTRALEADAEARRRASVAALTTPFGG